MSLINCVNKHYYQLPDWLLKLSSAAYYCIPQKERYGTNFANTLDILRNTEYLTKEKIETLINEKFIQLVNHAYYHVPFYRKYYDDSGVNISSIKDISDISKLPFINKDIVRKYSKELLADNVRENSLIYVTTSGSTGNPVGFYQPSEITMIEWAYTLHIWERVGYKPDSSRLVLRGKKLHPGSKNANYFYDPLRRELSCNIFDMRGETMKSYCYAIEKYKPEFIHGYMSAIVTLAKYIEYKSIRLNHQFKAILATSENILLEQKQYVEKVFNARVFSFYGHSERLIIAGECEHDAAYHVEPTYGYCELIDSHGNSKTQGEIVATGFLNYAMPLIRYKTGDVAVQKLYPCSCGRNVMELSEVTGRWHQDMLINSDGAYISLTALNIHSKEFDRIIRYKLIQNKKGIVLLRIQPLKSYTEQDSISIKKILEEKTNHKIIFNIELVNEIPIQKNGKYRIVDQHIEG